MTIRILAGSIAVVVAVLVGGAANGQDAGGEAKYEEAMGKLLESMGQMTKTLEMVVDEGTARSQKMALKGHVESFLKTRKESQSFAPPTAEVREKLAQKFRPEFEKGRKLLIAQIARVQRVPGGTALLQEVRAVFEKDAQ